MNIQIAVGRYPRIRMLTITRTIAQMAAMPVESLTVHQHSERRLIKAKGSDTARTSRETVAQITTFVSKLNSLGCKLIRQLKFYAQATKGFVPLR